MVIVKFLFNDDWNIYLTSKVTTWDLWFLYVVQINLVLITISCNFSIDYKLQFLSSNAPQYFSKSQKEKKGKTEC